MSMEGCWEEKRSSSFFRPWFSAWTFSKRIFNFSIMAIEGCPSGVDACWRRGLSDLEALPSSLFPG